MFVLRPVATVRSTRSELLDDDWDSETCSVELLDGVPSSSLKGLETFSHIELVMLADQALDVPPAPWTRHPRGNKEWPDVGIFANRNKDRPNRILLSVARLVAVESRRLVVEGLDAVEGTPVLDIKPWFSWSGPRGTFFAAPWSDELARGYF